MALGLVVPGAARAAAPALGSQYWGADALDPKEVNAWVMIDPDGSVTLRCPMAEMGQGTGSGLPMLLAEELECDWSRVKVEFASVNRNIREKNIYRDMSTVGRPRHPHHLGICQQGGASARARLIAAAAAKWNVPAEECSAAMGVVSHKSSGRSLGFGPLAADAAKVTLAAEPAIKTPEQYKLVGTRQPRLDSAIKSNGAAKYGIDTRQTGQLYASIASCPVFGGQAGLGR